MCWRPGLSLAAHIASVLNGTPGSPRHRCVSARRRSELIALVVVVSAALASTLTACSPSSPKPLPSPVATTGSLDGTATPCTGPAAVPPGFVLTVTVINANGEQIAQQDLPDPDKRASQRDLPRAFHFTVPPGDYKVTAPGDNAAQAHVQAGQTARVVLGASCL